MMRGFVFGIWLAAALSAQTPGESAYRARCVGCHGLDGTGGGHGPNVVDVRRPRATSVEGLRAIVLKGLPDAGMPGFPISADEATAIAAYFVKLRSPAAMDSDAPGDAAAGERF